MSVTLVAPNGATYPLNFADFVTDRFSRLGRRAEWRLGLGRETPVAIIVPIYIDESEDTGKQTESLVVAKIAPGEACVTGRVPAGPNASKAARQLADRSEAAPCSKMIEY